MDMEDDDAFLYGEDASPPPSAPVAAAPAAAAAATDPQPKVASTRSSFPSSSKHASSDQHSRFSTCPEYNTASGSLCCYGCVSVAADPLWQS
jgi:hypothetical protein